MHIIVNIDINIRSSWRLTVDQPQLSECRYTFVEFLLPQLYTK